MAADVYTEPPHVGRGGWTWYTGSAGWMYQAGLEGILGFRLRGTTLVMDPCIPPAWPGYQVDFRYHTARYEIVVENPNAVSRGVATRELDGRTLADGEARDPARRRWGKPPDPGHPGVTRTLASPFDEAAPGHRPGALGPATDAT